MGKETPEVIRKEAACFYNTQNFMMAIDRFIKLNSLCGLQKQELYSLAQCYLSLGNQEDATDVIAQIIKPQTVEDYLALSNFYFIIGESFKAITTIQKAYKIYPTNRNVMEAFIYFVIFKNIQPNDESIRNDFQKCLREYETSNYKNKIFHSFKITDEMTGEEVLDVMENTVKEFGEAPSISSEKYLKDQQERKLPLSFLKGVRNQNYFYIWDSAIKDPTMRIWSSWGNERDLNEIKYAEAEEIYIDLTSLLTLDLLGILAILPEFFKRIYITQSILDEIHGLLADESNILKPEGFISFNEKQQYKYFKYQKNYFQEICDRARRIEKCITDNKNTFKIVGVPIISNRNVHNIFSKIDGIDILKFDIDHIKNSIKENIPVMIDNIFFREAFHSDKNNPGCFGLVALLNRIANTKKWANREYYSKIAVLIDNNYHYFQLDSNLLLTTMKLEGYIISEKTKKVFNLIADKVYTLDGSIKIVRIFLIFLWKDTITIELKKKWSSLLLDILLNRKEMDKKALLEFCISIWGYINNKQSFEGYREFMLDYFILSTMEGNTNN